jgi:threonine dehydrogenase-like Zn-dependent dehydrogenase
MSRAALATTRGAVIVEYGAELEVRELPVPEPQPGALVVEVAAATICGTDVHLWEGGLDALGVHLPVVPGHEAVGRIVARGARAERDSLGQQLRGGDRVIWTHGSCGHCRECTVLGRPTLCPNRKVGMYRDCREFPYVAGTFAEHSYVWPEAGRVRVPEVVRDEWAAAASCALRSAIGVVESAGSILASDTVVIQGAGPLGLFATALASLQSPRRLIVIGGPGERLELARAWGASDTIDIAELVTPAERLQRVSEINDGQLADVVLELAGVPAAFAETIELTGAGGRIVVAGIVDSRRPEIPVNLITVRGLSVRGSFGGHTDSYWKALEFMRLHHERFDFDRLISRTFDLTEATTALRRMQAQEEIKPVLMPRGQAS